MRSLTEKVGPAPKAPQVVKEPWLTLNIELITPLYGGGVKAGENNTERPVRVSSIRGALRFWWRATRGAAYSSVKELREKESLIWGNTDMVSAVRLAVKQESLKENDFHCVQDLYTDEKSQKKEFHQKNLAYILFSAMPSKTQRQEGQVGRKNEVAKLNSVFSLSIDYLLSVGQIKAGLTASYLEKEILTALWAWLNFGGLGARSRRGCGAIGLKRIFSSCFSSKECSDMAQRLPPPEKHDEIICWFAKWKEWIGIMKPSMKPWTTLVDFFYYAPASSKEEAWHQSVAVLRVFRQGIDVGRNPPSETSKSAGRSRWPEADTIRRATMDGKYGKHKPGNNPSGFPRAAFGLPINFHFIKEKIKGSDRKDREPSDFNLRALNKKGKVLERMASPIILRPLSCALGKSYISIILRLQTPPIVALSPTDHPWKDAGFATYADSPMFDRSATGDALEAFCKFIQERQSINGMQPIRFREVK